MKKKINKTPDNLFEEKTRSKMAHEICRRHRRWAALHTASQNGHLNPSNSNLSTRISIPRKRSQKKCEKNNHALELVFVGRLK